MLIGLDKSGSPYFSMKTCCEYSLEAPRWGTSNEYPQHTFLWRNINTFGLKNASYQELWLLDEWQTECILSRHIEASEKCLGGQVVSAQDFRSWGRRFKSCWRQNWTHDSTALPCTEPFIITLLLSPNHHFRHPVWVKMFYSGLFVQIVRVNMILAICFRVTVIWTWCVEMDSPLFSLE